MASSIYEFVKRQRDDYRSGVIEVTPGYEFSQYETLRTIELYHNSKFLSGSKDSLGREKPFYNITKFRVNVATRATDLDTKDVQIESQRPGKKAYTQSFLLTLKNRNWMKQSNLAVFLNRLGQTRAKYGHVLVKKVERAGELAIHVLDWNNVITDQLDITSGVKIERHYYTPAELKTTAPKNWQNIDGAIAAAKKSKEADASTKSQENRTPGAYVEVYEVHGVLPTCYLAGTSDKYPDDYGEEDEYERQMHVVVLDESDKKNITGVTLYGGIETEDPYKDLAYERVPGRGLGVGVIEDLFEAQTWTNDTVKKKKDMLELAGKIIFQTADQDIAAKNILTDIENGTILTTAPNTTVTAVNNFPSSLPALESVVQEWNDQAENVTSTYPAILGSTAPHANAAYRLQASLQSEATALFEYRRQEAGIFIGEIYQDWVLPFLVSELKNTKELVASLEDEELEMISDALAQIASSKFSKSKVLSGKVANADGSITLPQDAQAVYAKTKQQHMSQGSRKSLTGLDGIMDDWEGTVEVVTTGEQANKDQVLGVLFQLVGVIAQNPAILQDQTMQRLFNAIFEKSGLSPLLISGATGSSPAPMQGAATMQQGASAPAAPMAPNRPSPVTAAAAPTLQ